ncbi:hypothetical protein MPL1_05909 [Methylophaga lonarensis MPL]|uniref:DUF2231 domain-containing protein n=1 Tax=Methylophaga lonarensis MPL TaxID=1286106 RepID=M7PSA5_9GAMM|nr:DUF2231 domain-containing protein [Methylophaga lonarensis]EMR13284.1 hypothetical protein MPL1_05909 [Methylophaga lonarensis MPL]
MIEIIPNWHPILVHFTIGLLGTSVLLHLLGSLIPLAGLQITARWTLWLGVLFTVGTVLTGAHAFDTVAHSTLEQHHAMASHRHWALITATVFMVLGVWSLLANLFGSAKFQGRRHFLFVILILVAGSLLAITGYKGGELVYRHGIGVLAAGHQHGHHDHDHDHDHDMQDKADSLPEHSRELESHSQPLPSDKTGGQHEH